jgi:hypothetical protein
LILLALASLVWSFASHGQAQAPAWAELTGEQQRILAPLRDLWSEIPAARRVKWIDITKRYPNMTAKEQQRLQSRMKFWASLTPQEREQVRERYRKLKEMPPEKREEIRRMWREYESLSDDEKKKLRQAHPALRPQAPQ